MSRSYKKTNISSNTCAESEKDDKRRANRVFRRRSKEKIKNNKEPLYDINEISDPWLFAKDGKSRTKDKRRLRK